MGRGARLSNQTSYPFLTPTKRVVNARSVPPVPFFPLRNRVSVSPRRRLAVIRRSATSGWGYFAMRTWLTLAARVAAVLGVLAVVGIGSSEPTSSRVVAGPGVGATAAKAQLPAGLGDAIHRALGPGRIGVGAAHGRRAAVTGGMSAAEVSTPPTAVLTNGGGVNNDALGFSVALSADGATALVGAPFTNSFQGAAYVFHVSGVGSWVTSSTPTATLTNGVGAASDEFGMSVALSADGATALVGGSGVNMLQGAAYVFHVAAAGSWVTSSTPTATLTNGGGAAVDILGFSVALSADGATALVGAFGVNSVQGAAYVFHVADAGSWATSSTPTAILTNGAGALGDQFGIGGAISADGATALVGAISVNSRRGAVYVFHVATAGSWVTSSTPTATLTNGGGAPNDVLGFSMALSTDGATALVGASGASSVQGAAYVFHVATAGSWVTSGTPTATLTNGGAGFDFFGNSVALAADGTTALIGAQGVNSFQGAAYVFHVATAGSWVTSSTPTATRSNASAGGVAGDDVGVSVALSADGSTALIGADAVNNARGASYVFPTGSGSGGGGSGWSGPTGTPVPAGGSLSSGPPGASPTKKDPLIATVTSGTAGNVTFTKTTGGPAAPGYSVLGYGMVITAPAASVSQPLVLVFDVAADSLPVGATASSLTVFRDGVPIGPCSASVDPCVSSQTLVNGVIHITVLSSHASTWTFADAKLTRVAGTDRVHTAIAASQAVFADRSARAVVLARSDDFADALAGGPLAAAKGGPLLLSGRTELDADALGEVQRVLGDGGTVFVLGGPAAVSDSVVQALQHAGLNVVRLAGATRAATAVAVADQGLNNPRFVVEVTGRNFADALSAGAAAAKIGAAILLTDDDRQAPATADYLATHDPVRFAIGGAASNADRGAASIAGNDRYATAATVLQRFFPGATTAVLVSGESYADGISASAAAAELGVPLLLVPATGELPPTVAATITHLTRVAVFGGTSAIGKDIADAVAAALI